MVSSEMRDEKLFILSACLSPICCFMINLGRFVAFQRVCAGQRTNSRYQKHNFVLKERITCKIN